MELDATGIEGQNQKLLEVQTKFEKLMKSAKDGLELDASALKTTLDGEINDLTGVFRNMTPKLPELPNVGLQPLLSGLSGLVAGLPQHTQALAGIATKFGSALTAGGFSLDTLVSDAASAIGAGTSLSAKIPNFELPSVGDPFQKAIEVLQANPIKPEDLADLAEKTSELVESPNFIALKAELETTAETIAEQMKTIDVSGLQLPEDTVITVEKLLDESINKIRKLPEIDDDFYSPADPKKDFTEVAFQHTINSSPTGIDPDSSAMAGILHSRRGGWGVPTGERTVVTKTKITTPEDATTSEISSSFVENKTIISGGTEHVRTVSKKANVSPHGFSYRPVEVTEKFYADDILTAGDEFEHAIELSNEPVKILHVSGYPEKGRSRHIAREIHPNTDYIVKEKNEETGKERIVTSAAKSSGGINRRFDVYRQAEYVGSSPGERIIEPREIEITADVRNYAPAEARFDTVDADGATITKPHRHRGVIYKVTYQYADFYDPQFSSTGF